MMSIKILCFIVVIFSAVQCSPVEDKEHATLCPPGMTECGTGCCPLPSAVCCSDGLHCCPSGYTCNYAVGGCTRSQMFSPFLEKESFIQSKIAQCPSGMTQCGSGCCPLPSAVCCSDGIHCCPNGYTCNYAAGGCTRSQMISPFVQKMTINSEMQASACPSGMTQCGAGCCPLPSAVCCSDGIHCCPNGYTCNYSAGGCTRSQMFSPFLEKKMF